MKMKMDLSDKYITEIEEMKRKHCLELEQLRAQLSEEHIKGKMSWQSGKLFVWLTFFFNYLKAYLKKFSISY